MSLWQTEKEKGKIGGKLHKIRRKMSVESITIRSQYFVAYVQDDFKVGNQELRKVNIIVIGKLTILIIK